MKTLQERAEEYAKKECNYNVDCYANSSCDGCQWLNNSITENQMRNSSKGFIAGYERHRHETRWRSVEEELPEEGMEVLVQYSDLRVFMACYENSEFGFTAYEPSGQQCYALKDGAITHWKLIE